MAETVKHPSHYSEGRKYEPVEVIRDWGLNFNLGNAVKYISRVGRKDNSIEDLKKAQQYLQFEIDALEAGKKANENINKDNKEACKPSEGCNRKPVAKVIRVSVPAGVNPSVFIERVIREMFANGEL